MRQEEEDEIQNEKKNMKAKRHTDTVASLDSAGTLLHLVALSENSFMLHTRICICQSFPSRTSI